MYGWNEPPGGFTHDQLRHRRRRRFQAQIAALVVLMLSAGTVASYQWVTKVTEVDQTRAVDLFRAQRTALAADEAEPETKTPKRRAAREAKTEERRSTGRPRGTRAHTTRPAGAPSKTSAQRLDRSSEPQRDRREPPEEGVYSWATEGYEQVSGARRQFPEETQRIITLEDGGEWTQHHYFSEERQIWTAFRNGSAGIEITQQRNEVTFGPVTRQTRIDFSPPMLAAPSDLRVGYEWGGEWTGDTYGDYSSKIVERTTMDIGGVTVEVWVMVYVINLRGDQEGQVNAEVWFAPEHRLTVKEHYVQDVESGGSRYHAEWTQILKSLDPQQ